MSELDEAWALALAEAERRARASGRADVADYLALRTSNDLLRQAGIEWLMTTFTALAGEANRSGASIQISTQHAHRFRVGNSTMVGTLLALRFGVRGVSIEAGWPRTPRDGFVRGGGLACGHVRHLGIKSADEELLLVRSQGGAPSWVAQGKTGSQKELHQIDVRNHIATLLDESR